jgi:hypothetical protein
MTIGHEDIAIGRNGNTGRLIEGVRTIPRYAFLGAVCPKQATN